MIGKVEEAGITCSDRLCCVNSFVGNQKNKKLKKKRLCSLDRRLLTQSGQHYFYEILYFFEGMESCLIQLSDSELKTVSPIGFHVLSQGVTTDALCWIAYE